MGNKLAANWNSFYTLDIQNINTWIDKCFIIAPHLFNGNKKYRKIFVYKKYWMRNNAEANLQHQERISLNLVEIHG